MNKEIKLAVLIDADNVSYKNISLMLQEITKYGNITTKRIYGDWTNLPEKGWKNVLLENAIIPIQQYAYTVGKNSTDSAMIIDAMDILYSNKVEGFCLVSSDSDFTRLATRLRESSMIVYGIGEKKTPEAFIAACDRFIFIENLKIKEKEIPLKIQKVDNKTIQLIITSIRDVEDEDGWAFLGDVGNLIIRKRPEFDPRNYGFDKLTPLLKSLSNIEIDEKRQEGRRITLVYVRLKK